MSETSQNSISALVEVDNSSIKSIDATTKAIRALSKEAKALERILDTLSASDHKTRRGVTGNLKSVKSRLDDLGASITGKDQQDYKALINYGIQNRGQVLPKNQTLGSFSPRDQQLIVKATKALSNPDFLTTLTRQVKSRKPEDEGRLVSAPLTSTQRAAISKRAQAQIVSFDQQQQDLKLHSAALAADRRETRKVATAKQRQAQLIDAENKRVAESHRSGGRYRSEVKQNERDLIAKALKNNGDFTGGRPLATQDPITQKRWVALQQKLATPEFQRTLKGSLAKPESLTALNENLKRLGATFADSTAVMRAQASARAREVKQAALAQGGGVKQSSTPKPAPPTMAEIGQRSREASRERMFGDGGAHLFKTQGALLGNYALMGGGISGMMAALQFTVELDKSFNQLQSIVRLTDTEMRGLEKTLISVSEKTKFTAVEVAEAATVLGQAGFGKGQIEKAIEPITLFATAVGTDLKQAVELGTAVMGIFSMEASQLGDVANIMTTAVNKSKLTMDKLSLGLQYSGNLAAQAGIDFKELLSLLGAMANSGIRSGSMLGTGFRQVLIALQAPTDKFKKRLSELGVSLSDLDVRTHGMVNVLKTLTASGFTSADAMDVLETRSAAAFSAMVNNLDVADALGRSMGVTASAAEANAIQMTSLANQWDRIRSVALSLGADAFGPMKDFFTDILRMSADLLGNLRAYAPAMGALKIAGSALGAYGLSKALLWVGGLMTALIKTSGGGMGIAGAFGSIASGARGGHVGPMGPMPVSTIGSRVGMIGRGLGVLGPWGLAAGAALSVGSGMMSEPEVNKLEKYQTGANAAADDFTSADTNINRVDRALGTIYDRSGLGETEMAIEINKIADSFRDLNFTLSSIGGTTEQAIQDFKNLKAELLLQATVASDRQIYNLNELAREQNSEINKSSYALRTAAGGQRTGLAIDRNSLNVGRDGFNVTNTKQYDFDAKTVAALDTAAGIKDLTDDSVKGMLEYRADILRSQDAVQKQLVVLGQQPNTEAESAQLKSVLSELDTIFAKISARIDTSNQIEVQDIKLANTKGGSALGDAFDQRLSDLNRRFVEAQNDPLYRKTDFQLEQAAQAKRVSGGFDVEIKALIEEMQAMAKSEKYTSAALEKAMGPLLGFKRLNTTFYRNELEEAKPQQLEKIEGELNVATKLRTELESKQSNTADQKKVREYQARLDVVAGTIEELAFEKVILGLRNDEGYSEAYNNAEASYLASKASRVRANRETADKNINRLQANSEVDSVFAGAPAEAAIRRVGDSEFKKAYEKRVGADSNRATAAYTDIMAQQSGVNQSLGKTSYNLANAQSRAGDAGLLTPARVAQNKLSVSLLAQQNDLQMQLLDLEQEALTAQKTILQGTLEATDRVIKDVNVDSETARVAKMEAEKLRKELADLNKKIGEVGVKRKAQDTVYTESQDKLDDQGYFLPNNQSLYLDEKRRRINARLNGTSMKTDAGNDEDYAGAQTGIFAQVVEQTNAQFQGFDPLTEATVNLQTVVDGLGDSFGNVFASILDGTQSGSKAFKAMGHAIFSDMTQMASKMLANQLLKQLFTWIGGAFAGSFGGDTFMAGDTASTGPALFKGGEIMANYGGAYKAGGEITSGVSTRDSTYIHAAKGEFMLRKEAVDAIGVDTARSINNLNKGSVKNATSLNAKSTETRPLFAPQVNTAVYLLDKTTPPPSMGPNEVLATINDDMVRNGRTKTLIKQIASGAL